MPSAVKNSAISARFSRPIRSSVEISSGHIAKPCAMPWVNDSEMNPPFRPDAPNAMDLASNSTTLDSGFASRAEIAAHRPVKPPPTITRSAVICPVKGEQLAG